ncbi:MAG: hypothetical protein NVSMB16_16600 [Acidimicrobiales bacterium]
MHTDVMIVLVMLSVLLVVLGMVASVCDRVGPPDPGYGSERRAAPAEGVVKAA